MKNLKLISFSILMLAGLFLSSSLMAQGPSISCANFSSIVAEGCVGACGNPGELSYEVTPPCPALSVPLCLSNIGSNPCPSHRAIARVWVNGTLVASGDITPVGSSINFNAPCGSVVKVKVLAINAFPHIHCVQLGDLKFALHR